MWVQESRLPYDREKYNYDKLNVQMFMIILVSYSEETQKNQDIKSDRDENEELKKDIDSKYFILISSFSVSPFLLSGDADHDDGEDGIEDLSGDWCVRRDMKERKKPGKKLIQVSRSYRLHLGM